MQEITDNPGVASASYRLTTDGAILNTRAGQITLFDRLSKEQSDAGYLLTTPTAYGKTEGIVIPSLGLRRGGAPRRLFLIAHDGSPLDDPLYRLVPYLRSSAAADEAPRTWYVDTEEDEARGNHCCRFFPNGSMDCTVVSNPLEADVDLVLTTFSRFRNLFFGSGGIHGLPSSVVSPDGAVQRRDLFYFDEAHDYTKNGFARFHRLVEFLYAEDTDIVVGSSTLPGSYIEELSFLEELHIPNTVESARQSISYFETSTPLDAIETEIRTIGATNQRVCAVVETIAQAEDIYARIASEYPESARLYHSGLSTYPRRRLYTSLMESEAAGDGYILITTGAALESSDINASVLLTTFCAPENLILRAGRCNRRGGDPNARILVIGSTLDPTARPINSSQLTAYQESLRLQNGAAFEAEGWKVFI